MVCVRKSLQKGVGKNLQLQWYDFFLLGREKLLSGYFPDNPTFHPHLEMLKSVVNLKLISIMKKSRWSLNNIGSSKDNNEVLCFIKFRNHLHILISRQTLRTGVRGRNKYELGWHKCRINKINVDFGPELWTLALRKHSSYGYVSFILSLHAVVPLCLLACPWMRMPLSSYNSYRSPIGSLTSFAASSVL